MLRKRLGKKGFTLVEIIVVLVILAILAAILIPSMVGWIDKANQKTVLVEGRSALLAAQTLVSEKYGTKGGDVVASDIVLAGSTVDSVQGLAGLDNAPTDLAITDNQVTKIAYSDGTNTATYENGAWTVAKSKTTP